MLTSPLGSVRCGKKRCFPVSDPSDAPLCSCTEIMSFSVYLTVIFWMVESSSWMHTCTNICFIFLYAFFCTWLCQSWSGQLFWALCLFACVRLKSTSDFWAIWERGQKGVQRSTCLCLNPHFWLWNSAVWFRVGCGHFVVFLFLCNAFIQQNVRVGAAGYLKVIGSQTNRPFGKTIVNDTVKHQKRTFARGVATSWWWSFNTNICDHKQYIMEYAELYTFQERHLICQTWNMRWPCLQDGDPRTGSSSQGASTARCSQLMSADLPWLV